MLARADSQVHGAFPGSRIGPSWSIPCNHKCLALSLLGFTYVASATALASGNLNPWLGRSFHSFFDSSESLWQLSSRRASAPKIFFFVSTQLEILSFWEILGQKNITSIWKINLKFQCLVSVVLVVCGKKKGKGSVGGSGNLEKIVINIKLLKMLLLPFNH